MAVYSRDNSTRLPKSKLLAILLRFDFEVLIVRLIHLFCLSLALILGSIGAAVAAGPSFVAVVDNLDLQKNTKLHAREYWKSVQGQEVTWSGEVYDVQGGAKARVKIFVADKARPLYKGYNMVLSSTDVSKAAALKRGQKIKFKGVLRDFNGKRSGAVIEVADVQIL
jgi:hypothetical protein